jgi:hypothetical protein
MISKKRCFLYVKNANLAKKLLEIIGFLPIFQSGKVELMIFMKEEMGYQESTDNRNRSNYIHYRKRFGGFHGK